MISIHAPREGCDETTPAPFLTDDISIHAPREGCDLAEDGCLSKLRLFQSTHPVRGATHKERGLYSTGIFQSTHPVRGATCAKLAIACGSAISIHAPREGCDSFRSQSPPYKRHFNPRTP